MPSIRRILVPVDFSPCSRVALDHAVAIAERFDATVHVVHTWEVPAYLRPDLTVWSGEVSATLSDHAHHQAQRGMHDFLAGAGLVDRPGLTAQVLPGAPYASILALVDEGTYDLVVMGTHGRTGLSHLVLGSVAEKVVRHSRCPVLTVREPQA